MPAPREPAEIVRQRANWFFGFPVHGEFSSALPALPTGFRKFHPEDVHMTLAFLGGCGEAAAAMALAALDDHLQRAPQRRIAISFGAVVPMGPPRRYSALSALLGQGRDEAATVIAELRDVLTEAARAPRDDRPPKPHVTLARPQRRATDDERRAGSRWATAVDLSGVRATLDRIALYTWTNSRHDRLFRIVAERSLT